MTRMIRAEHDHLLMMIEQMQREGQPEASIHEAVRRATRGDRPERRQMRRLERLRLFGRRQHRP
jgi:hypothetical protein